MRAILTGALLCAATTAAMAGPNVDPTVDPVETEKRTPNVGGETTKEAASFEFVVDRYTYSVDSPRLKIAIGQPGSHEQRYCDILELTGNTSEEVPSVLVVGVIPEGDEPSCWSFETISTCHAEFYPGGAVERYVGFMPVPSVTLERVLASLATGRSEEASVTCFDPARGSAGDKYVTPGIKFTFTPRQ